MYHSVMARQFEEGKLPSKKEEEKKIPSPSLTDTEGREGTTHTVIACTVGGVGGYTDPLNNPSHKAVVWGCCEWDG